MEVLLLAQQLGYGMLKIFRISGREEQVNLLESALCADREVRFLLMQIADYDD